MRIPNLFFTALLLMSGAAHAEISLNSPQNSISEAYVAASSTSCLRLELGGALNSAEKIGLQKLTSELHIAAGANPESAAANELIYNYNLVPELKGEILVYKGILPAAERGVVVYASSRSPASLAEIVEKNLPGRRADLVLLANCDAKQ